MENNPVKIAFLGVITAAIIGCIGTIIAAIIQSTNTPQNTPPKTDRVVQTVIATQIVEIVRKETVEVAIIQTPRPSPTAPRPTPIPVIPIQPTSEIPIPQGYVVLGESGERQLILSKNQVVMGTADRCPNLPDNPLPPFIVFVIYGPINERIKLPWGGWDQWENANPNFIEQKLNEKIEQTKENHPKDWNTRTIKVLRCVSSIKTCCS